MTPPLPPTAGPEPRLRRRAYLAISVATFLWGIHFPIAKHATAQFDPIFIAGVRMVAAAFILFFTLPAESRRLLLRPAMLRQLLPLSLTGIVINQILFAIGLSRTTPAHSAALITTIPIFVAILARIFLGERLLPLGWLGILLGAIGASGVIFSGSPSARQATLIGDLTTLGATIAFACYYVLGRRLLLRNGAHLVTAGAFVGAIPVGLVCLGIGLQRQDWTRVDSGGVAAISYMAVLTTVVTYLLFFWALQYLRSAQVAAFANAQPVLAATLSVFVGMESLAPLFLLFGSLALVGVFLVQLQPRAVPR